MENEELEVIILDAKDNQTEAIERLLDKYKSMIHTYSFVNGELKEELKHELEEETINAIKRFQI